MSLQEPLLEGVARGLGLEDQERRDNDERAERLGMGHGDEDLNVDYKDVHAETDANDDQPKEPLSNQDIAIAEAKIASLHPL